MRSAGLACQIIRPKQCVLAIALPTTEDEFNADRVRNDREIAGRYGYWGRYRQEVATPAVRLLRRIERLGAKVVRRITLEGLGQVFRGEFSVIVLVAHWKESGAIELADGFADLDPVLAQIPRDAERILDLGACRPWPLVKAIRRERSGCLMRLTDEKATPVYWLAFYLFIFHQLRYQRRTYLDAVKEVVIELRRQAHG